MKRFLLKILLFLFLILLISPIDFMPGLPFDDIFYFLADILIFWFLQRAGLRKGGRSGVIDVDATTSASFHEDSKG